ncbi:type II toxin-antitoxin system toxin DNA ADP-ribosyl transferase DarT [Mucilaginibacter endophyticus]|uniref:type II toxin-antitoxin system toxin DNA ADP-ribosyl transferase DarT n=1 Tax=Mucilaginibacter endophyticus TaxID=2675003 RepID=UPI000E0CDAF3|nr:DUF4433 domain-containing protein [Mucilaginibacter endophyticus]
MTHIENIPHILVNGITHQRSLNSNVNYVPIGSGNLISKRDSFLLPNGKTLGSYIPFYFGVRMPMLYVIKQGVNSIYYNLGPVATENIIYCITTVELVRMHKLEFVFSNGHAVSDLTDFFDKTHIDDILDIIDVNAINARYWRDDNDLDLKRRKEAEFLVFDDIPASAILGFAVYNESAEQKLLEYGIGKNKIAVKAGYYF